MMMMMMQYRGIPSPFWLTLHPEQQIHTVETPLLSFQRWHLLDVAMVIAKDTKQSNCKWSNKMGMIPADYCHYVSLIKYF